MTLPNISGLVTHFDATKITNKNNNDDIQQWNDESGNDYHLTQNTTGLRPVYKTSVQNGLPGVYFSSNGHMGTPTWTTISEPFSAFLVHSSISPSDGVSWDSNGGARSFIARDRTNGTWRIWNGDDFTNHSAVGQTTDILLLSTRWSNTSNHGYIRFNKGNEVNGSTRNNGIGSIRIAADEGGGRELTGYYCEILLYDRALTEQEIEDVEDYLWDKWFVEKLDVVGPFPTFRRST